MTAIEYDALQDLYISTNGANWNISSNYWNFSPIDYTAPCLDDWYGITCNDQCQVVEIYLPGCNLDGSIPSSIGNLVQLTDLNLNTNQLSGSIPSSIGNLVQLTYLAVSYTHLTLPTSDLV